METANTKSLPPALNPEPELLEVLPQGHQCGLDRTRNKIDRLENNEYRSRTHAGKPVQLLSNTK